ncbi:sensor histidine kinase [Asanoa iriomotensis]|uniref:histidine kinase n=1 Tax=Asanoa iriomotensis TaxID=234613 RepID=A0ABQ4CBU9_9ACTN|nr:HAMP domain-containing sensor histidine kinase [Asanoa iriomotensis]GIF60256.1 two-component sensor histidine kinase [Asanoa iriomotensis]
MPATERPRLRGRLALAYAAAAVVLGAVPVAVVGLGLWTGRSTQAVGATADAFTGGNTGQVLLAVVAGLVVVALVAAPVGWALAGRALRPLREVTAAAGAATADRLPGHGALGRYAEFAELSATLAGLYRRLDSAYAAQRRFVADASHELRTPLTVQRALIQVALADPAADAASLRAVCAELLRVGEQQERLVAALLALARGQQGLAAQEPVDLAAVAASAIGSSVVSADLRPALVARADPTLVASLVGNLVDNALRHNVDGGRVDVSTGCSGTRAVLVVANTGPVVPADAVDRILEPFQRLRGAGGSGLGLAIVRAVADSHDADLSVVPNPGGGLTVTVGFPAAGLPV